VDDWWLTVALQAVGLALLILEAFLPSGGVLGAGGVLAIAAGLVIAFRISPAVGAAATAIEGVVVPLVVVMGLKHFRRSAIGRRVAPPNPVLTEADASVDLSELRPLIGRVGRSLSPLRPVGVCEFGGRRLQCVAEGGLIEANSAVTAVSIVNGSLTVRAGDSTESPPRG